MKKISAVIITKNEERNIGRCLQSLQGVADEIIVVDSGSTDRTEALCREAGVRFVPHPWEGYSAQKNYANSLASCDWILSIDADEALSPRLRDSLLSFKRGDATSDTVCSFNRLTNYCGHWIRHCGWYPDRHVRLFATGTAEWDGQVHEELRYLKPTREVVLDGDLLHYSYYSVEDHARRQLHYATLAAQKAYHAGKRTSSLGIWLRPDWTFFRNYVLKGGFLDGHAGYTVCRMSAVYTFLKYVQLRELYSSSSLKSDL